MTAVTFLLPKYVLVSPYVKSHTLFQSQILPFCPIRRPEKKTLSGRSSLEAIDTTMSFSKRIRGCEVVNGFTDLLTRLFTEDKVLKLSPNGFVKYLYNSRGRFNQV